MTTEQTLDLLEGVRTRSSEPLHLRQLALWQYAESLIADSRKLAAVREKCEHYSTFPYDNAVKVLAAELLKLIDTPNPGAGE